MILYRHLDNEPFEQYLHRATKHGASWTLAWTDDESQALDVTEADAAAIMAYVHGQVASGKLPTGAYGQRYAF